MHGAGEGDRFNAVNPEGLQLVVIAFAVQCGSHVIEDDFPEGFGQMVRVFVEIGALDDAFGVGQVIRIIDHLIEAVVFDTGPDMVHRLGLAAVACRVVAGNELPFMRHDKACRLRDRLITAGIVAGSPVHLIIGGVHHVIGPGRIHMGERIRSGA